MEQWLKKKSFSMVRSVLDKQEECPISGEYVLPEYCPDVAVVLKCFAYPHIQNRQWSGERLLVDGSAVVRVLYLDEGRRCMHSVEFAQPFSCTLQGEEHIDNNAVELVLTTKYLNCRALSSRRIEVRGAIHVSAYAEGGQSKDMIEAVEGTGLYVRTEKVECTIPGRMCEKILTVSEAIEFNEALPPAERLLGGECCAAIKECKILMGKAIVKGQIWVHQLYTDSVEGASTHSLDYTIPFSQILDVEEACEGAPYKAFVHVLSDAERCVVGPDGENTILDVTVKILVQLQVYSSHEVVLLKDAFHSQYPLVAHTEEAEISCFIGMRWESATLPMQITIPASQWQEIVDVWVCPLDSTTSCVDKRAEIIGRMRVCVAAKDVDGEVVYDEFVQEYGLEYPCEGDRIKACCKVMGVQYRTVGDNLELQVALCVEVSECACKRMQIISDLRLQKDTPYAQPKVTALLYYADAGESVWDIGRTCHTAPSLIMEENALEEERIQQAEVLVVPVKA